MGEYPQAGENGTSLREFIILGFQGSENFQIFIFILFFVMYILTIIGNFSIIFLVLTNHRLHTPMYLFLCNLSFLEIWYTTASIPKILAIFLGRSRSISLPSCVLQMYFIFSLGCTEHNLIAVMAYDRYLAICYPLHYHTIMSLNLSKKLASGCWLGGFLVIVVPAYMVSSLSFCGSNLIDNFYCNLDSWIVLSCTGTHFLEMTAFFYSHHCHCGLMHDNPPFIHVHHHHHPTHPFPQRAPKGLLNLLLPYGSCGYLVQFHHLLVCETF